MSQHGFSLWPLEAVCSRGASCVGSLESFCCGGLTTGGGMVGVAIPDLIGCLGPALCRGCWPLVGLDPEIAGCGTPGGARAVLAQ